MAHAGGGRSGFTYFPRRQIVQESFQRVSARCDPDFNAGTGAGADTGAGARDAGSSRRRDTEVRSVHTNMLQLWHNLPQLRGARIRLTVTFEPNPHRMPVFRVYGTTHNLQNSVL